MSRTKKIIGSITGSLMLGLATSAVALPLVPPGDFEGVFFRNSEVLLDNDQDGEVSVGDQFWGVVNLNELINAGADATGQTGAQIWPLGGAASPPEVTAYFAQEVTAVFAPGAPGGASASEFTIILGPTVDPNGILAAGDMMNWYEDGNIDYNDATQASALATATDGTLLGSFTLGAGYWYTLAPVVPPGSGDVGESFAALYEGTDPFPWTFSPVNDPNEDYSSGAAVVGGLPGDFWFNSELFSLGNFGGPDSGTLMHFGSNDPGVFAPVPEPAVLALIGMGLFGAGMRKRGRKV